MAIPRAQVYVPVTEGLTLSLPIPEVISVQPSKAPDHGHDQASDHTVVKSLCVSFPLSHFTGGLVQSLNMLSERKSMVPLPPSWVPIISDGSQSFSISKLIEQRNHTTVIAMCLVIISDMQWSVHTTHRQFSTHNCLLLSELPILLNSIDVMRACAEQALRNMMDMYIYFLFMYVSQSNLVLPVSLSGLITLA